jgi:hypothetical protein
MPKGGYEILFSFHISEGENGRSTTLKRLLNAQKINRDNYQTAENPLSKVLCILEDYYYRMVKHGAFWPF